MKRQVLLNAAGYLAQIIAGLVAVPWLLSALGVVGFGLFSLALAAVGYLGLFDLGFGRALTRLVADRRGRASEGEIPDLVRSAIASLAVIGGTAATLVLMLGADGPARWLALAPHDAESLRRALPWLAVCLPFAIGVPALNGVLEGYMRFDLSAAARALGGVAAALGPVIATRLEPSLAAATAGLCVARGLTYLVLMFVVARIVPAAVRHGRLRRHAIGALLRDGGWLTITNLVGPLMASLDRFAIGRWVSVARVSDYAAPYEALTRVWALPDALLGVMFPALAHAHRDTRRQAELVDRSLRLLLVALVPVLGVAFVLAPDLLTLWIGADMAARATTVARWLAVGVLVNGLVRVPFVFLQASGRADLPARAHVLELVPYVVGLWLACRAAGVEGAAAAWTARISVDAVVLGVFSARCLPALWAPLLRVAAILVAVLAALAASAVVTSIGARLGVAAVGLLAWVTLAVSVVLHPAERALLARQAARLRVLH